MAGRPKTRAAAEARKQGRAPRNSSNARRVRRQIYGDLVPLALASGADIGRVTTSDVLEECLSRAVAAMRFAGDKLDGVEIEDFWRDTIAGKTPHEWFRLEQSCRREVSDLAFKMESLGLAERRVQVEEARAALVVRAIQEACREVGIQPAQVKALGPALRAKLEAVNAGQPAD